MTISADIWATAIADLITYCSRIDAGFAGGLVGASEADLAMVVDRAGHDLPEEYIEFLKAMGRCAPGNLGRFLDDVTFGVKAICEFYEEPEVPVPGDAVYLWTFGTTSEMFLPVEAPPSGIRSIVQFEYDLDEATGELRPDARYTMVLADSLLQYLYQEAFKKLRVPSLAHHAALIERPGVEKPDSAYTEGRRQEVAGLADRLGFTVLPFMGSKDLVFDRPDAALGMAFEPNAADTMFVGADEERELLLLCEIMMDNLDLSRLR